ncbi:hypothetical protein HaLaN_32159 [Haematococcus lacustris]|uniref:Uncharacterized protein n=1 Tax=Haematococcus lacustris TaxID=44745 RepID=A0A6A0AIW7_HAELA|nr:hypothetical protein HaLaN_32159 [Haematococcus lacustris]
MAYTTSGAGDVVVQGKTSGIMAERDMKVGSDWQSIEGEVVLGGGNVGFLKGVGGDCHQAAGHTMHETGRDMDRGMDKAEVGACPGLATCLPAMALTGHPQSIELPLPPWS